MGIGRSTLGHHLELAGEKVAERANVGEVDKEKLLHGWAGSPHHVEGVVVVGDGLAVSEDENDLAPIEKHVLAHAHSVGLADPTNFLAPPRHPATEVDGAVEQASQLVARFEVLSYLLSTRFALKGEAALKREGLVA